jgi:hypothetical protein
MASNDSTVVGTRTQSIIEKNEKKLFFPFKRVFRPDGLIHFSRKEDVFSFQQRRKLDRASTQTSRVGNDHVIDISTH